MMADAPAPFTFGFGNQDAGDKHATDAPSSLRQAEEVPSWPAPEVSSDSLDDYPVAEGIQLLKGRISGEQAASILQNQEVASNDLIPNCYEGGFKLWEGALDLCKFLVNKYQILPEHLQNEYCQHLKGKRVLELGCGHGLPGILMLMAGATVHFQDYNKEVLTSLTIPNVVANLKKLSVGRFKPEARFFCGDWATVGPLLTEQGFGGHYDIILTSESIYSLQSQERLVECIKQVLQPPHGVVYVAAKSYYFGVGGGTKTFLKTVKDDGIFEANQVFKAGGDQESGVHREILELKFPDSIMPYFL